MSDRLGFEDLPPAPPPAPDRGRGGKVWVALAVAVIPLVVSVGLAAMRGSDPTDEAGARASDPASASPTVDPLRAPRSAKAAASAFEVVVTWKPSPGRAPDTYAVFRDGEIIAHVPSTPFRVVDTGLVPMTRYTYWIVADDAEGSKGPPAVVRVTTEAGTPAEARLSGTFDVSLETTSRYGYGDDPVDEWSAGMRFVPDCKGGPCDVEARDIHGGFPMITLTRDGAVYTGSGSGRIGVTCGGTEVTSSLRYQIRVTAGKTVGGVWRATKFTGTLSQSEPTQLGCRASGSTSSLQGRLVP